VRPKTKINNQQCAPVLGEKDRIALLYFDTHAALKKTRTIIVDDWRDVR
jgi:gamma-glutamyl phosphate reductase